MILKISGWFKWESILNRLYKWFSISIYGSRIGLRLRKYLIVSNKNNNLKGL